MNTASRPLTFLQCSGSTDPLPQAIAARRFWPFGQLTPQQEQERAALLEAMQAGELRRIPTVFGDLDEVTA
jgi:hypothetical protein